MSLITIVHSVLSSTWLWAVSGIFASLTMNVLSILIFIIFGVLASLTMDVLSILGVSFCLNDSGCAMIYIHYHQGIIICASRVLERSSCIYGYKINI